jgi:hypothetical protein
VLTLSAFCGSQAANISQKSLTQFNWKDALTELSDKSNLDLLSLIFPNSTYLINPPLHVLSALLHSDDLVGTSFLCTPLHWLFLLRFVLVEKYGKLSAISSAILAWKSKHASSKPVDRWRHILSLEDQCVLEKASTGVLLSLLPPMSGSLEEEYEQYG